MIGVEEFTGERPDYVDAVRAAVAEAGFDPSDITPGDRGLVSFTPGVIPYEVAWRALTAAGALCGDEGGFTLCYSCTLEWWLVEDDRKAAGRIYRGCRSTRPFERSCGRVVSDWSAAKELAR